MNQSMAIALAEHKINVNAIAPGFVESIPLGRIEQPEDVANTAVYLASSDSDYFTQQTINVDGDNWPG